MTTLPQVQVLVDWVNNPIGASATAGANFTDISSYVMLTKGVNTARGRQDNISIVQPARCTLTVSNDDGRFTPGNTASPYSPGVIIGRRIQVNVKDETGTYHTRFDGMLSEFDINDTPTGKGTSVQIICTDVLSFLNRYPEFSCWTVEECNYQGTPMLQYLMNEPTGSPGIYDSSGNNGPLLMLATYSGPPYWIQATGSTDFYLSDPVVAFQSGNNPVEGAVEPTSEGSSYSVPQSSPISSPLSSVQFSATMNNNVVGNTPADWAPSAQFQGEIPVPVRVQAGSGFTLLAWVWPDSTVLTDPLVSYTLQPICLSNTRTGSMISVSCADAGGDLQFQGCYTQNYNSASPVAWATPAITSATYLLANAPFMVAVVVTGTSLSFYIAGNLYTYGATLVTASGTAPVPAGATFNYLSIGGPIGGGNGWLGNISNVCLYDTALSTTALTTLGEWGAYGPETQATGIPLDRAAVAYTGVPSYWQGTIDSGLSLSDYVDITGAEPSDVIEDIQAVEHGLFFMDAKGRINFHDRSRRMGAAAPTVTLPAGSYDPGIKPKVNDQYLINFEALQNERGGSGVVAQNAESVAQYGVYPNGSVQSPETAPYTTAAGGVGYRQFTNPGSITDVFFYSQRNISDAVNWDVNTLGQPALKLAALTVDMLANQAGQNEYIAPSSLYSVEIDQPIAVDQNLPWWPNAPMSSELFVEGINEVYTDKQAQISFYTSPAFQSRAWIPGSSAYGQLDVSARVGISNMTSVHLGRRSVVPSYASGMNLGAGADGFIGAYDQAGISENLQLMLTPPLVYVAQVVNAQSAAGLVMWDTTFLDTASGMNISGDAGTTYSIQITGWYEVCVTVNFAATTDGISVWIAQNQTGSVRQVAPVSARGASSGATGLTTSAVIWCVNGDAIGAGFASDFFTGLSIANGGSHMSLRYRGQGTNTN
jgi:hypothetical protein